MISTATVERKWVITGTKGAHYTTFTVLAFDHFEAKIKATKQGVNVNSCGLFITKMDRETQRRQAIRAAILLNMH